MEVGVNQFDGVELGIHCAKCGMPIIRGAMPYKKIGDKHYHEWCLEENSDQESD